MDQEFDEFLAETEAELNKLMKDGGPAFPLAAQLNNGAPVYCHGMKLRDYFAGQALIAMRVHGFPWAQDWGRESYKMADQMLAAREMKSA